MGFFRWLREQVRQAVLGGIQDAVNDAGSAEFTAPRLELRLDALVAQATDIKGVKSAGIPMSAPGADANGHARGRKAVGK
jgi:hypothetical protein